MCGTNVQAQHEYCIHLNSYHRDINNYTYITRFSVRASDTNLYDRIFYVITIIVVFVYKQQSQRPTHTN